MSRPGARLLLLAVGMRGSGDTRGNEALAAAGSLPGTVQVLVSQGPPGLAYSDSFTSLKGNAEREEAMKAASLKL